MSTFKKAKVVMLPTNQKAKGGMIYLKPKIGIFNKTSSENHNNNVYDCNPQHLYIISDDEIKGGDWFYNIHSKIVGRAAFNFGKDDLTKKIIATTDASLLIDTYINQGDTVKGDLIIKRGSDYTTELKGRINLPQPSQQFIQKFVEEYNKGNIITDVMVEYINYPTPQKDGFSTKYSDNITLTGSWASRLKQWEVLNNTLKTNSKDNTITIKKVKDNYSREEVDRLLDEQASKTTAEMLEKFKDYKSKDEVIDLIVRAVSESHDWSSENNNIHSIGLIEKRFLNKWIEENL